MEEIACKRHMGIWETLIFANLTHQLPFDMVEIGSRRGTQKNIAGQNIKREVEEGLFFTFVYNINISYLNCFWNSNWTSKGCSDTLYTTSSDSVSWPAAKSTNLILVQEVTRFKILQFVTQNSLKYPLTAATRFFYPEGKKTAPTSLRRPMDVISPTVRPSDAKSSRSQAKSAEPENSSEAVEGGGAQVSRMVPPGAWW